MGYLRNKRTGEVVFVPDAGSQGVPIGPQDPAAPFRGQQAATGIQAQQSNIQSDAINRARTGQQMGQDAVMLPPKLRTATAEAAIKEAEARRVQAPGGALTAEQRQSLKDRLVSLQNLEGVIGDLEGQYKSNFKGRPSSRLGGLTEFLPGALSSTNQKFNSTALRAGPFIQSILGLTGKEADAAAEYERKVMPFVPRASDYDATTESKLKQLRTFLNTQRTNTYGQLGTKPPVRGAPRKPVKQSPVINFDDWKD